MKTEPIYGLPYLEANDLVQNIATNSQQMAERLATVVASGDFRGPRGEQGEDGPQGLPGVNAVPADTAMATYLQTDGSASSGAVKSLVEESLDQSVDGTLTPIYGRLDALEQDAPTWVPLTLATGVTATQARTVRVKVAGIWFVGIYIQGAKLPGGTIQDVATADADYRPKAQLQFFMYKASSPVDVTNAWITSSGDIRGTRLAGGTWSTDGVVYFPVIPFQS